MIDLRFSKNIGLAAILLSACFTSPSLAEDLGEHGYAKNGELKIHYVTAGEGPLVVMLHGFPDYWYTWRKQIPAIAKDHQVVAIDMRGFNKSDQPEAVEDYAMPKLVSDVKAVIDHFGRTEATIIGHDWGGMVAWSFAMQHPEITRRLIILNLPHPACLTRELANNPAQQAASAYARHFQQPDAASNMTAEGLTFWVKDAEVREQYIAAMRRSSMNGMLNYYKANYPREPYTEQSDFPKVQCPVPDDSRPEGHSSTRRWSQWHLELHRQHFHAGHGSKRRPFCAAGCSGIGHRDNHPLACRSVDIADGNRESRVGTCAFGRQQIFQFEC